MELNEIISSGLLELYVLGMATEQETAQVIAMSKQYPEVAAEILSIELSLEHYANIHCVNPHVKMKEQIYDAISGDKKNIAVAAPFIQTLQQAQAKVVPVSSFWKYAAAACIILLIGSAALNYIYYNKYEAANSHLNAANREKSNIEQQLAAAEQSNDEMKNNMHIVQSRYSEPHVLPGLAASPDAVAKIFWMKDTHAVYIDASNLPEAPAGKQYQFWGIVDGKPVDGGLIKNEEKLKIQKMKSFGRAEAFAVTLETIGGNPTPLGTMYVMGKM